MAYIRSASQSDIVNGTSVDLAVSPKNLVDNVWFLDGSTLTAIKKFGTVSDHEIPFIQHNTEKMRLTATGLGIGLTNPNTKLEVDSGTNNVSGVRLTKLTSASPTSSGAAIGVNANGDIVRISILTEAIQTLTLAGSSGTPQTLSNNDTITIAAGTGITTTAGATDTITVALNATLDNLTDVTITSPVTNQVLQYNGTTWVNSGLAIDELTDVDTATTPATNGDSLTWNGTNWVPTSVVRSFSLAGTSGTPQTISDGNTLTIAAGTGITTTAGSSDTVTVALNATLDNLSDVVISTPASNQVLLYNGTNWVNTTIGLGTVTSVAVTDTTDIDLTITEASPAPSISGVLTTTTVTAGSYGSASSVGTFTVDSKGRLTAAGNTSIAIAASQVTSGTFADARISQTSVTQHEAALTILESQITDGSILARVGGNETITGTWSYSNNLSIPLTPTQATHAASKGYVDSLVTGLDWKNSVRAASTASVSVTYTASGGTSARGQITNAPNTIDGVNLQIGDRILLKDQSPADQNGIWVVTTVGTGANGVWDRANDFDTDAEVTSGAAVFVTEGTTNGDSGWVLTTNDPITIGGASGTALSFAQFSGAGQINAGNGLTKTGNTIDVVGTSGRIVANADSIDLATTAVTPGTYGTASSVGTFTVDAYGRLTLASSTTIAFSIDQLTDVDTTSAAPSNGNVLSWNGTNWVPSAVAVTGASNGLSLSSNNVILGGTLTTGTTITQSNFNLNFAQNGTGKIGVANATPVSGFDVNTSVSCGSIRTVTGSTTLTDTDYMILVDNSSSVTITLPSAASAVRREYVIKKISSTTDTVVIDPNASELIDGGSTYTIGSSYVSIKVKTDGTSWYIF